MKERIKDPYLLEKHCLNMFKAVGWDTTATMEVKISENTSFRPDITLSFDNKIFGCVETSIMFDKDSRSVLRFIEKIRFILNEFKPTVFVLTNGYIFDLYLEGEYFNQITYAPSPEDIILFLESKREDKRNA